MGAKRPRYHRRITVRRLIDWLVTIVVALVAVLAFEAEVAKPYRVPSSSMEPIC